MTLLTRIKPLLDFPLKDFPQANGRFNDLYELRTEVVRSDGYFLLLCEQGDYFTSSFPLMLTSQGNYMLGRIQASESKTRPDALYYDVYIHGGSLDCSAFCTTPQELAEMLRTLNERGMEYVFTDNEAWGVCYDEKPFEAVFTEYPTDIRFAIMFDEYELPEDDDQNKVLKRLEEFFE